MERLVGRPFFEVHREPGNGHFRLVGEIDMGVSAELVEHVRPAVEADGDITLDLSGLGFIDSSGIHAIFQIAEGLGEERSLILRGARGEVARVLELVGAHRIPGVEILAGDGTPGWPINP